MYSFSDNFIKDLSQNILYIYLLWNLLLSLAKISKGTFSYVSYYLWYVFKKHMYNTKYYLWLIYKLKR